MYMYTLSLILLKFEDVLDNFVFDIRGMRAGMKRRECSLFEFSAELEMVLKKGDVNTSLKDLQRISQIHTVRRERTA